MMIIAAVIFTSSNDRMANAAAQCSSDLVAVKGVKFGPGNWVFHDDKGTSYVAGNVINVGAKNFSATIRSQVNDKISVLLDEYILFRNLSVGSLSKNQDRYGRLIVNLYGGETRRWLQQDLIRAGVALVSPEGSGYDCLKQLFLDESIARANSVGIWQTVEAVMRSDDQNWMKRVQSYQLVEGIILSVGKTSSRYYLNFGENWSEDFTVVVAKRNFKRFKKVYGDLKLLAGKKIRVRGWMVQNRGPMIEIFHPGQIEVDIK